MDGRDLAGDCIFKCGTSLSKCFRLVECFSEDIDVLVLPDERGRGATDELMKAMADVAAEGVADGEWGRGERDRADSLIRDRLPRVPKADRPYPHQRAARDGCPGRPPSSYVGADQLSVERRARGGRDRSRRVRRPHTVRDRRPSPGTHPPRKARPLHALAQQLATDHKATIDRRSGRPRPDRDQTEAVMRSVEKINHAFFGGDGIGVRPAGGFASCPASESTNAVSTGSAPPTRRPCPNCTSAPALSRPGRRSAIG
jgi:hypothetical protein